MSDTELRKHIYTLGKARLDEIQDYAKSLLRKGTKPDEVARLVKERFGRPDDDCMWLVPMSWHVPMIPPDP
jgi:hypothetical protein